MLRNQNFFLMSIENHPNLSFTKYSETTQKQLTTLSPKIFAWTSILPSLKGASATQYCRRKFYNRYIFLSFFFPSDHSEFAFEIFLWIQSCKIWILCGKTSLQKSQDALFFWLERLVLIHTCMQVTELAFTILLRCSSSTTRGILWNALRWKVSSR